MLCIGGGGALGVVPWGGALCLPLPSSSAKTGFLRTGAQKQTSSSVKTGFSRTGAQKQTSSSVKTGFSRTGAQEHTNSSVKTGFSRTGAQKQTNSSVKTRFSRTGVWLIWEKLGQHRQIQIQNAPQLLNCGVVFIMQFLSQINLLLGRQQSKLT